MMDAATGNCANFTDPMMMVSDNPGITDPRTPNVLLIIIDDLRYDAPFLADAPNYRSGLIIVIMQQRWH